MMLSCKKSNPYPNPWGCPLILEVTPRYFFFIYPNNGHLDSVYIFDGAEYRADSIKVGAPYCH